MKACHSCGEPLHHPNTGHTVICPSCGFLFDFENPESPPDIGLAPAAVLPKAPLKSRARWIAVSAFLCLLCLFYYAANHQAEQLTETEQAP